VQRLLLVVIKAATKKRLGAGDLESVFHVL
jgi:hypothetical protein